MEKLIVRFNNLISWFKSRPYSPKLWLAIVGATFAGVAGLVFIILLLITPPITQPNYYPFATQAEYQQFLQDNPFFTTSPPKDLPFTILQEARADKQAVFTISLSTRPLKPNMTTTEINNYLNFLDDSQKQAIQWIKDQNIDPNQLNIIWRPDPQQTRQSLLNQDLPPIPQKDN